MLFSSKWLFVTKITTDQLTREQFQKLPPGLESGSFGRRVARFVRLRLSFVCIDAGYCNMDL